MYRQPIMLPGLVHADVLQLSWEAAVTASCMHARLGHAGASDQPKLYVLIHAWQIIYRSSGYAT